MFTEPKCSHLLFAQLTTKFVAWSILNTNEERFYWLFSLKAVKSSSQINFKSFDL